MISLLKKSSAWIPIAMSLTVFVIMLVTLATAGVPVIQTDEGTGAHLFQIWFVLEILMGLFFAIKWLPQRPIQTLLILTIQVIAVLLPMSIVFFLKL